jgi:hypothetical protein
MLYVLAVCWNDNFHIVILKLCYLAFYNILLNIFDIMPVIISNRTCFYFSSGKSSISYNGPVASRLYEITDQPQYPVLPTHA